MRMKRVRFIPLHQKNEANNNVPSLWSRGRKRIKWSAGSYFLRSAAEQQLTGTGIRAGEPTTRLCSSARRYSYCGGVKYTRNYPITSMFLHTIFSSRAPRFR